MRRVLAGIVLGMCCAGVAFAAASPIVGIWSMTVRHGTQAISVVWDEFDPDGKLHVRFVTPAGTEDYYGTYVVVDGGRAVRARFTDYGPKVLCTLVCSRVTPVFTMGAWGTSPLRFALGAHVMYLGADRYNRQR